MNDAKQNRLLKAKIFYPNMTFTLKIFRNQSSTKIRQNSYLFYPRNGIAGHTVFFGFDSVPCFPLSRPSRRGKLLKEKMALVAKMCPYGEMRAARKIDCCCWCRLLRLRRVTLERSRIELRSKGQAAATVAERIGATANVLQVPPRTCHITAKRCNLSNSSICLSLFLRFEALRNVCLHFSLKSWRAQLTEQNKNRKKIETVKNQKTKNYQINRAKIKRFIRFGHI